MFGGCENFNCNLSSWDVSNVTDMCYAFIDCEKFKGKGLENWNVTNVTNMRRMFEYCESFNQDLSSWNVSNARYYGFMFYNCPIKEEYKPKFK